MSKVREAIFFAVPIVSQQEAIDYLKNEIEKVGGIASILVESAIQMSQDQLLEFREDRNVSDDETVLVCMIDWKNLNNIDVYDNIVSSLLKSMLRDRDEPVKVRIILTGFQKEQEVI